MNAKEGGEQRDEMALWGGLECTVNRVSDEYFSQLERNGHANRLCDLERFASLGIRAIRYPVLWEHLAPKGLDQIDWSWSDVRLAELQERGIAPIVGLVHHGSGPRYTSLMDPEFAEKLAAFAGVVAKRYPWVEYYTPINEPLTTARFSGLYGVWYPHGRDDRTFIEALLNQCRAVVLSMRAIRQINPNAKLVQTDDLGKSYSTRELTELASFYNERRWLAWDLLCGRVGQEHRLWEYLVGTGIEPSRFLWFRENVCLPEIIGINYYITSERWLDQRIERYPGWHVTDHRGHRFVDIEPVRVLATPTRGIGPLLDEAWERYRLPLAVTEAHMGGAREDQLRWLLEIWQGARNARQRGVDIRAVTVWALLGSYDWNCLVTACNGYYEPGPFDVRSSIPRPTAVAALVKELGAGARPAHPVLKGQGWWRRPERLLYKPVATQASVVSLYPDYHFAESSAAQPILITGATGTLGRAFATICKQRNLASRLLNRQEMDIAERASVEAAVARYRPWAIINASGYVNVDNAEKDKDRCFRENTLGPSVLASVCRKQGIELMTFSSDLVFDGGKASPYLESDTIAPLNHYGRSKAEAERKVFDQYPEALVVRTSAFFGPWDLYNFVTLALQNLAAGASFAASSDITVSPTYVPDLVDVCLDLLIDREAGIWHLTNGQPITWLGLALKAAERAGIDASRLEGQPRDKQDYIALRPFYSALWSERGILLPTLEDALDRYMAEKRRDTEVIAEVGEKRLQIP
ncbi:dTDP-4-dehydrorhamnose reductase [Nitrosospira multiformis]|uniref:dTDP-4-dehydrorhamnose reductase n=1 Tax=Nitrosospira multiformis TaxID=1231 RepID=A0A1H8AT89_9PROT|nr:family 1 glycosylhydrolase [Nitrosospira multiformis]SEM73174.1 dTDP-4-dehydrorhamnose reductase [Nitrosospira multiformis]